MLYFDDAYGDLHFIRVRNMFLFSGMQEKIKLSLT